MIARIQDAGMLHRCDAYAMNAANESPAKPPSRGVIGDAGSALSARSATAIEDITAATTSAAVPLRHDEIEAVSMVQAITGKERRIGVGDGGRSTGYRQIGGTFRAGRARTQFRSGTPLGR
jgi:hypothetical protein